jgi:cobalt-zinc-cadmium resistance protein CzcA
MKAQLEQIRGTREGEGEVEYETTGRAPMLEIKVKRDVLAKYNLHAGDVNQVIAAALGGESVGTMIEGNRRFDIVVRLAEKDSENVEAIRTLTVRVGDARMLTRRLMTLNESKRFRRFCATRPNGAQH